MQAKTAIALKEWLRWDKAEERPKGLEDFIRQKIKLFIIKKIWRASEKVRYAPVIEYISEKKLQNVRILEIGSGPLGLTKFINKKIIGLDINFEGPRLGYLIPVKGDGGALPFRTLSFDYTICLDMLEHINHSARYDVLSEILRVTKKTAIVGFPSGKEAEEVEQRVRILFETKIKNWKGSEEDKADFLNRNVFLLEHKEKGVPSPADVIDMLHRISKAADISIEINVVKNESIKFWYYFATAGLEYDIHWIFSTLLFNFLPASIFNLGWGGFYRTIIFIEKNENFRSNTRL